MKSWLRNKAELITMHLFTHLWQRVFAYALLLVLISHVVSSIIFRLGYVNDMDLQFITEVTSNITSVIEGKDLASIEPLAEFFNNSKNKQHRLWLESPDGKIIFGEHTPEFIHQNRRLMNPLNAPDTPVTVFKSDDIFDELYLALAPVRLKDGDAIVCISLIRRPPPPVSALFLQGLTAVCIIGGMLSIWVTWHIARPLHRLSSEVLYIADGHFEAHVNEHAPKEISQVAKAVNHMAYSLSQNIKSMRELVANLSHEMRSPLARMSISSAIVEEGLDVLVHGYGKYISSNNNGGTRLITDDAGVPLACVHIKYILQEINHMENLVNSSLLSCRLDSQHNQLELQPVDISRLCTNIALRHEALIEDKGLSATLDIQPDLWVYGDRTLLSMLFSNLLDNAVKYTDKGGGLSV